MRGRKPASGYFELRTCSGKKTAENSKVKGDVDNVVIIDLDGEDVTEADCDQSIQPPSRSSGTLRKDKQSKKSTFIYIDDDEDSPVISVEDLGDVDSDATSNKSYFPASDHRQKSSVLSDSDECQVVREKGSSSKGSKCKQTNSAKAPSRNRYGFGFESESDSLQSDCSDCEVIEASTRKLHEHWERVSRKRKSVPNNCQSASADQVSGSGSHSDTAEVENRTAHAEIPVCSTSENANHEKENLQNFMGTGDRHFKGSCFDTPIKGSFAESNKKVTEEWDSLRKNDGLQHGRGIVREDPLEWKSYLNDGISGLSNGEESPERPSSCSTEELSGKHSTNPGTCSSDNVVGDETHISDPLRESSEDQNKATVLEEIFFRQNQHSGDMLSDHEKVELNGNNREFHDAPTFSASSLNEFRKGTSSEEKDKAVSGQPSEELHINCGVEVPGDSLFFNKLFEDKLETSNEKACSLGKVRADYEDASVCNTSFNGRSNHGGLDSSKGKELCHLTDQLLAQDGDVGPVLRDIDYIERDIINDREKLKETAEYKRAVDEEMASRQRALQIQAEEAQRLRKRKKAENMRLLDMQRRQKQRVEEVRETQKKDQENLNLKDQIRAEVRTELRRLEFTCIDMASLLRGLGIQVGDGLRALPNEVHAAYKRALLKFHPDRASKTDIRQQVESEEKFKLISRMKEKLMLTSCY